MLSLAALVAGALFGLGLAISQMVNPAKVLAFLDIAGRWDPNLAFVMLGALTVAAIGFRLASRRSSPVLAGAFRLPTSQAIDRRLLGGAALFGIGWGLVGFCPGPAIAALAFPKFETLVFVIAMVLGAGLFHMSRRKPAVIEPTSQRA